MENGDSAHSEHSHRNRNNTRYYLMHGTRTVVLLIPLNDGKKRNQKLQPPEHPHRQQLEGGAPYKLGRRVRTVHRHEQIFSRLAALIQKYFTIFAK